MNAVRKTALQSPLRSALVVSANEGHARVDRLSLKNAKVVVSRAVTSARAAKEHLHKLGADVILVDDVLEDSSGKALYVTDQEGAGKVLCTTSACTAIWVPLTVPSGQQPSGASTVSSHLGTVMRPDGTTQVTWDGKPLYTFSFDHGAGQVTGDGKMDSFGSTSFTWHVATASGTSGGGGSPSSSSNYGGSGY